MALRRAGKGYVLGVNSNSPFNSWAAKPPVAGTAAEIAGALDPSAWHRLSAGAGAKGERLFDWAYLELADLEAAEYNESLSGLWTRGLLIRRNIAKGRGVFGRALPEPGDFEARRIQGGRGRFGDRGLSDPRKYRQGRPGLLRHLVPRRYAGYSAGHCRRTALGH